MKKKLSAKKIKREIRRKERKAAKELEKLSNARPDLFRRCGGNYCCQATTADGHQCTRPSMLGAKTYIKKINCCMLCWQHASQVGLYGLYKGMQFMHERNMSWDEYCALNPEYCTDMFK